MASVDSFKLIDGQTITATITGNAYSMGEKWVDIVGFAKATALNGTMTIQLQHSPNGSDWIDLGSAATMNNPSDAETIAITVPVLAQVRAKVTLGTATTGVITVSLHYRHSK